MVIYLHGILVIVVRDIWFGILVVCCMVNSHHVSFRINLYEGKSNSKFYASAGQNLIVAHCGRSNWAGFSLVPEKENLVHFFSIIFFWL